ncbi:hypothetical protein N7450_004335 [Penicillium hetheringtonii]|uniref:Uncharacterized protein n=1 Tax=Penicillium hetheringtonii TaxID=911720 RepID=A0AAD6DPS2_9EURO|nr:hypothetical protein N7450_004335 [Penicillium hetheringtonii]
MYFPRHEDREYYGTLVSDPDMRRTSEEMWAAEKSAKEKKGEPSETEYYEAILQASVEEDSQYELPEEDDLHPLVRLYSRYQYYPAGADNIANEIISMKEDPNYFHEFIKKWSEYQTEKISGLPGKATRVKKGQKKNYMIWDGLIADFQRLAEVIDNNRVAMNSTKVVPRERVPLDVVDNCSKLIMKVMNLQTSKMQSFMTAFAAAPGLRKRFSWKDDDGGGGWTES